MSGGKETPRQKMISLMYLVLIAMLALQVSSTVLFKFEQLNENLILSNAEIAKNNKNKLGNIGIEAKKREDAIQQIKLHKKAEEIHKRTSELSVYMTNLKEMLIEETGGRDDKDNLKGAKEETKVEVIMLGPNKNGKGYELKEKLDQHISWMNKQGFGVFEPIALNADEHPSYRHKPDQSHKDFANLNFANAPLVAALATISELENNILATERQILDDIALGMDMYEYKVKGLTPIIKTNSNYVVAGKQYEADLFLTAQLATEKPKMFVGTNELSVDEQGMGKVSFKVSGGNYGADGTATKKWIGKIKVKQPNGKDTIYEVEQEYVVAKPTLQFQSAAVQSLYLNCGNVMNLSVPELGLEFNPSYEIMGGTLERGSTRGELTVLPTANHVTIKVKSDGVLLGEKNFRVKKVPLPNIVALNRNRTISPQTGIKVNELDNITLQIIPDKSFKDFLPREANYQVTKWTAMLVRGKAKKGNSVTGKGKNVRLRSKLTQARTGDRVLIEIEEVKRKNAKGNKEVVKLPQNLRFVTIALN